jgi:hypothetical protein
MSQVDGTTGDIQVILYACAAAIPSKPFSTTTWKTQRRWTNRRGDRYGYPNLGCDLLLDEDGDLAISVTGDLALTPNGRVCLLQDIADLLETCPRTCSVIRNTALHRTSFRRELQGGIRPSCRAGRARRMINDPSVAPRLLPETVQVDMERYSDTELSVSITASAIDDGQIVPLNFVWQYGLDDVSRIFVREAAQ